MRISIKHPTTNQGQSSQTPGIRTVQLSKNTSHPVWAFQLLLSLLWKYTWKNEVTGTFSRMSLSFPSVYQLVWCSKNAMVSVKNTPISATVCAITARVHFTSCYVPSGKVSSHPWIIQLLFNALLCSFKIANSSGTHSVTELVRHP